MNKKLVGHRLTNAPYKNLLITESAVATRNMVRLWSYSPQESLMTLKKKNQSANDCRRARYLFRLVTKIHYKKKKDTKRHCYSLKLCTIRKFILKCHKTSPIHFIHTIFDLIKERLNCIYCV